MVFKKSSLGLEKIGGLATSLISPILN